MASLSCVSFIGTVRSMGRKNDGKPYEKLTQRLYQKLVNAEMCQGVQHDVMVQGTRGTHQIDVMFEFIHAGISHRTIIQCKDWKSRVKQEHILSFASILDDIPGQPRGIFVARSGFQKGARQIAESRGIQLYELREPRDKDWEGLLRTVSVTMNFRIPRTTITGLEPDVEWLKANYDGVLEPGHNEFNGTPYSFMDIEGVELQDDEIIPLAKAGADYELTTPQAVKHTFERDTFVRGMRLNGTDIPLLKILSVSGMTTISKTSQVLTVSMDHMVAYCFRDVISGGVKFLDIEGHPLTGGPS